MKQLSRSGRYCEFEPVLDQYGELVDGAGCGDKQAGQDAADLGERGPEQTGWGGGQGGLGRARWSFPWSEGSSMSGGKAAWVTARKARASMTVVTCRCQGVHLRTWYWVGPG
ncbi:hypothetical protein GCM10023075_37240 [Streptosporangium album]